MHTTHLAAAFALAAALAVSSALANPPVAAFGTIPAMREPKIAPDGKHFAAIQSLGGKPALVIYEVDPAKDAKPVVVPSTDATVDNFEWASAERLVVRLKMSMKAVQDNRMRTWYRSMSIKADGSGLVMLLNDNPMFQYNIYTAYLAAKNLTDPSTIFIPIVVRNFVAKDRNQYQVPEERLRQDLFKVNLDTGHGSTFATGIWTTQDWIMDGYGKLVARIDQTQQPLEQQLMVYNGERASLSGTFDASGDSGVDAAGLTEDARSLAVLRHDGRHTSALMRRDLATGNESEVLFADPDYDVMAPLKDEWSGRVIGAVTVDDRPRYNYFDEARQSLQAGLEQAFPGLNVRAVSMDAAKEKVIVSVEGPRHPPEFYFLNRTTHAATQILSGYPGLSEADLGEMKPYSYAARDGLGIHAYLTLPPGQAGKNLPVVVLPHGGPDGRDAIGFSWWAQFLANRGYAVFQPNYRGSRGYGRAFTEAGFHQWGLKMQDDITDGVKKLVADGIADPKRICIVGTDYGGYAALAGAAFTPDLYACAASVAGISDLNEFVYAQRSDHGQYSHTLSFWVSRIGSDYDDGKLLDATSPGKHADAIKIPVLLMHGEGDAVVRINQSERMNDALTAAHKNVTFIRFAGEDHALNFSETRIRMLTELETFLKKSIGN